MTNLMSRPASMPGNGNVARPIIVKPSLDAPMMAGRNEFPFMVGTETYPFIVAANATASDSFIIDGENAFILETIRYTSSAAFRLLLAWGSQSAQLMNKPLHVDLLAGTAQRPGFWSRKGWCLPIGTRTVLTIQFTNLSTTTNTIEIAIAGYRRFLDPGMQRTTFTGDV